MGGICVESHALWYTPTIYKYYILRYISDTADN